MSVIKRSETYFVSAGEHSGDLLGADLVLALKERLPRMKPFGVCGEAMLAAGVEPIASVDDLSVMGIAEVAKKLGELRMLETSILRKVELREPRFAVLIDNPGLHIRMAEQLRMRGIPVFQYVAPKLWAWGENRVHKVRENFDLVLGILPFEEEFFKKHRINYAYVGSPLKDRTDKVMIRRESLGLTGSAPVIACLPGSRPSEVARIMPILAAIKDVVRREHPNAQFLVPMAGNLELDDFVEALNGPLGKPEVREVPAGSAGLAVPSWEVQGLRLVQGMSLEVMAAADVAIVASGTATLECALLGTPMVVVYAMNDFTYQIAKRSVKIPYVSLVNLMAGRKLVNEYIQDFSIEEVAEDVLSLLADESRRRSMSQRFEDLRDKLKGMAAGTAAELIAKSFQDHPLARRSW